VKSTLLRRHQVGITTAVAAVGLVCSIAQAVRSEFWTESTAEQFKEGTAEQTVITNLGRITLSRRMDKLLTDRQDVSVVLALAGTDDGRIYAATGMDGLVLQYHNGQWRNVYKADQPQVLSLIVRPSGRMYVGVGGRQGKVIQVEPDGASKVLLQPEGVHYVWALALAPGGKLYAATGPTGKLFRITEKTCECIFTAQQDNLLSLVAAPSGTIYVGTDTDGLVYRLDPQSDGKVASRVLYDADESDITALALDRYDNLYAAGSVPSNVKGPVQTDTAAPKGRPDTHPAEAGDEERQEAAAETTTQPALPAAMAMKMLKRAAGKVTNAKPPKGGNAVYKIDPLGFVTEVFRDNVNINAMIETDGRLYLGTGPQGLLFEVTPAEEKVAVLAETAASDVTALHQTADGKLLTGTADPGQVLALAGELADEGTFTSQVFDAGQIARWGRLKVELDALPEKSRLTVQTRSSNVEDPENDTWSRWSKPAEVTPDAPSVPITSPAGRFLQYRLTFTRHGNASPIVRQVRAAYMQENLPPKVESITVQPVKKKPGPPPGKAANLLPTVGPPVAMMKIAFKATDANKDQLRYDIYLREVGSNAWILIEDNYTKTTLTWDSTTVADGKYEFKVQASDALDNPQSTGLTDARISDPVTVDHTAPLIENLTLTPGDKGELLVEADLIDNLSEIASARFTVDSQKDWQMVAPVDDIFDSPAEHIAFTVRDLSPGEHRLTIQAYDLQGNSAYANIKLNVPLPAKDE